MEKIKRGFIRGLWGIYEHEGRRYYKRRTKLDNDMKMIKLNKNAQEHVTYVFGEDNYKFLVDQGFDARLIDKRPVVWNMEKEQFRHKLEVLYQGLQEFDEIVFLDWDCTECKPLPPDFWERLAGKEPIQAVLRIYHKRKATWRDSNTRTIPEASFVYIREKKIGQELNDLWEKMHRPWSEEVVLAKYIDKMHDGWHGIEHYWEHNDPFFATWGNCKSPSPSASEYGYQYIHINGKVVSSLLKKANGDSQKLTEEITKLSESKRV